jgi:LysR family transcriptional regulator, glycine cleavage system transcriptional activator
LKLTVHRDSENDPLTRQFCAWLEQRLNPGAAT